ncbi:TetR/AcrR family transcriptional regulator [Shimia sp.]|uniref:TetR/AcrR family transcriptional regulator n=1 Tax=Shimia sp. TaxID=1954381 RepID=UPI0035668394
MVRSSLSPDRWIDAGFDALVARGPAALKAEALARDLGTTKGSFYWHFKDVPEFHRAMLNRWEEDCMRRLEAVLEQEGAPVQRLRHLSQVVEKEEHSEAGAAIEPAMRAWARGDETIADAVARVDGRRMAELSAILKDIGLSNPELARILYAANLGMAELSGRDGQDNAEALGTLVDLVLALYG